MTCEHKSSKFVPGPDLVAVCADCGASVIDNVRAQRDALSAEVSHLKSALRALLDSPGRASDADDDPHQMIEEVARAALGDAPGEEPTEAGPMTVGDVCEIATALRQAFDHGRTWINVAERAASLGARAPKEKP